MIVRDRKYLEWRFANHPIKNYSFLEFREGERLDGYFVMRVDDGGAALIVDYFTSSNTVFKQLLKEAIQDAVKRKCTSLSLWAESHYPQYNILRRFMFIKSKSNVWLMGDDISCRLKKDDFVDKRRWFITMGDCEMF